MAKEDKFWTCKKMKTQLLAKVILSKDGPSHSAILTKDCSSFSGATSLVVW